MIWSGVPWFFWHRQSVTIPIIKSFFQILRTENPDLKIGVAGFCWGGRYALLLGQEHFSDMHLVDAVFTGHPSLVSIPKDVEAPYCPTSVAVAGMDSVFSTKMAAKVEELWKERAEEVKTEIIIYEGAKHGFCVRGNMKVEQEKKDMENAIQQV
jgi:dienelactone hydrolase